MGGYTPYNYKALFFHSTYKQGWAKVKAISFTFYFTYTYFAQLSFEKLHKLFNFSNLKTLNLKNTRKLFLTSSPSKYDKTKTVSKWGIWTPTGVLVGYYPPTLGVGVWGSLDPPKGV